MEFVPAYSQIYNVFASNSSLSESWIICTWRLHLPPRAADQRSANKQHRINLLSSSHKPVTIQKSRG